MPQANHTHLTKDRGVCGWWWSNQASQGQAKSLLCNHKKLAVSMMQRLKCAHWATKQGTKMAIKGCSPRLSHTKSSSPQADPRYNKWTMKIEERGTLWRTKNALEHLKSAVWALCSTIGVLHRAIEVFSWPKDIFGQCGKFGLQRQKTGVSFVLLSILFVPCGTLKLSNIWVVSPSLSECGMCLSGLCNAACIHNSCRPKEFN